MPGTGHDSPGRRAQTVWAWQHRAPSSAERGKPGGKRGLALGRAGL